MIFQFTLNRFFILLLFITGLTNLNAQQLAFPGAEGYGKYTVGGRGGIVYEVTNLNDSGTGSLRAAVEATGPRTVVFRVSGTIILTRDLKITNPYITIAGQTAPGDGICLRKYALVISANQVIIRYIRVRLGDESGAESDAISSRYINNLILDHVSASWSVDETMSVYHCDSVTIQWCMISESLYNSNHEKGPHGYGGIWGSNNSTSHHNLLAHHSSRNPRMASGCGNFDYRNNAIYNWGYNSCYGGEQQQVDDPNHAFTNINMVANYYKPGPATKPGTITYRIANPSYRDVKTDYGKWYIADNNVAGNPTVTANNWNGGVQPQGGTGDIPLLRLAYQWPSWSIDQQTADKAYSSILDNAGATLPKRDAVDTRIVRDVLNGDATYEGLTYEQKQTVPDKTKICGIIDSQTDVGGWPELKSTTAPADSDHDGIPDVWENTHGLNPNNINDGKIVGTDGYTNLEKYLNSIEFSYPVDNYKLTKLTETGYKLEWSDNFLAENGFRVERSVNNGVFEVIASLPKYSTSYSDNAVPSGLVIYRVIAFNNDNETPGGAGISITITAVDDLILLSEKTKVNCFPNPFSDELNFAISGAEGQKVIIELFDLSSNKIATIANRTLEGENYSFVWSISNAACDLKPGLYIVSITTGSANTNRSLKLIKKQ
jgi:pectate lyase